jgi:4-amino-4-deoxy-L-arabinose transferase-like glycosyltransferase
MLRQGGWLGAAVLVAIVALGFALRFVALDDFWLNGDEGIYYFIAHAPPGQAAMAVTFHAHPPAYYYLLRAVALLGDDFVWLRLPSLMFGCLAILAVYALAREFDGRGAGWVAALVAAVSPGLVMQSQVVRPYALLVLAVATALAALVRYVNGGGRGALALYGVALLVAISIQYGAILVGAGIGIWLAVLALRGHFEAPRLRDLALAHVPLAIAAIALYLTHVRPRLLGSEMQASAVASSLRPFFVDSPVAAWQNLAGLVEYLAGVPLAAPVWVAFWLAVAFCIADRRWQVLALASSILAVALLLSALDLYPFGGSRHSLHLAPLLIAVTAVGMVRMFRRNRAQAVMAAGMFAMLSVIGVSRGGILGMPAERAAPFRELEIPVEEVGRLRPSLAAIRDTPGVAIFDKVTAYTLAPILQSSRIDFRWHGEPKLRSYRWGKREVFTVDAWFANLGGSQAAANLFRRIARDVPGGRALLGGDVRVIAFSGQAIPDPVRSLDRLDAAELASNVERTRHFAMFELDVPRYRKMARRRSGIR